MLFPILPRSAGDVAERAMFAGERLWKVLHEQGDDEWKFRVGDLIADLERFVTGEVIAPKYLKLLAPARDAIWEIRSCDKDPSIRVLGLFAKKDVFIATNVRLRSELGGWDSEEWRRAKREAAAIWRQLFGPEQPVRSTTLSELVTGYENGRYFEERSKERA